MEEKRDEVGPSEKRRHGASWWPSGLVGKFGHVSLDSKELYSNTSNDIDESSRSLHQTASQILWSTGMLSQPIPNGFYSVVPEKRLKETFEEIPSLDELLSLELEGVRADVILVDVERDKKLSKLKQLILALVKGLNSNPASVIKKIAGLVSDCYKRQFSELSPANAQHKGAFHAAETKGVQMLGQIKQGSCRPRAILFKVLADTVGLDSRLIVGLPAEGNVECLDSHKHMSVMVVLNSVELLVDLMRFPGQLRPLSTKALVMAHVSVARERDFAENDSCDSPLEPNSPLCGFSEKADHESSEKDDNPQYHRRLEASLNVAGTSLRNKIFRSNTFVDRKMSSSHQSEPNIANTSWRRSRREIIAEQRTASSSPEHPSAQARERSMLSGDNKTFRGFSDDIATSRSEGASASETCRIRRRSISMIPEIGDDIARAVRAMNEALKQNRFSRVEGENSPFSYASDERSGFDNPKNGSDFHHDDHDIDSSTGGSSIYSFQRDHINSQKAISLPSSPHEYMGQTPERSGISNYRVDEEMVATWNQILRSPTFQNKPLLPYEEWNIDFSELVVGTRVGIGFFGEVFRGTWNGTDVAIKVFLEQDLTTENMEDFCNEITILSRLRHPNVILFLGACTRPPRLSMITEYMEMGSLYFLIHLSGQKKKLSIRRRLKMLRDICRGLLCIHRMKIIHCDIKSANCLVNKHWTVKICDFGLSRIMTDDVMNDSSSAGTPEWMAPELIRNQPFNEKCDIFSLGVIMWELCTLNRPWDGVPPERVVYSVANEGSRLEIPEGPLGRLISDCWAEPHERPSCEDILVRLIECENTLC